jgi:hypothetical protein
MSHRVTTKTEIKDKALAVQACKQMGVTYVERGDTLDFTSGALRGASLNLKTGDVTGDTDFGHTHDKLGALRQAYGEAKYRYECNRQGIMIESRTVNKAGEIELICAVG